MLGGEILPILGVLAAVWAIFYVGQKDLGGGSGEVGAGLYVSFAAHSLCSLASALHMIVHDAACGAISTRFLASILHTFLPPHRSLFPAAQDSGLGL